MPRAPFIYVVSENSKKKARRIAEIAAAQNATPVPEPGETSTTHDVADESVNDEESETDGN